MDKITRAELIDRTIEQIRTTIDDSGLKYSTLSKELNVSIKTIQKWRDGSLFPSVTTTFALYDACYTNPEYSVHQILRPGAVNINYENIDINDLRKCVLRLIKIQDDRCFAIIYYTFFGDHGSDPIAYWQMGLANAQTTVGSRQFVAHSIYHNYKCAELMHQLTDETVVQPDIVSLKSAIDKVQIAYYNGKFGYVKYKKDKKQIYIDRLAAEMKYIRETAGISISTLARNLGTSESVILKYESGASEPNIIRFFDWCICLNVYPEPICRAIFHPHLHDFSLSSLDKFAMMEKLEDAINNSNRDTLNSIHYQLSCKNKSSVYDYLQMSQANLMCPIGSRQNVANTIDMHYDAMFNLGRIDNNSPKPNMNTFHDALELGISAYVNGLRGYFNK